MDRSRSARTIRKFFRSMIVMPQTSAKHLFSSKVILPPKQLCTGKKTGFHRFEKMPPKRFRLGNFFEFHAKKTFRDESTPDNVMKKVVPK